MGFWCILKDSALELLHGILKLRHCTDLFTKRFPPWSLRRVGNGGGKRNFITPGNPLDTGGNVGKRGSSLPERHVQVIFLISIRIQGIQRRGDGKDCAPLPPKEWEVRWASLAIFFLALGLGEVCTGYAWNLPSEGTGVVDSGWSVQPKGSVHWHQPV